MNAETPTAESRRWTGLSTRLMLSIFAFVLLAECLVLLPSIVIYRNFWIGNRVAEAQSLIISLKGGADVRPIMQELGIFEISLSETGAFTSLAALPHPADPIEAVDMRDEAFLGGLSQTLGMLMARRPELLQVTAPPAASRPDLRLLVPQDALRRALFHFTENMLLISLTISGLTGLLVYALLHRMIVRPIRQLSEGFQRFRQDPEDATRIITPSTRRDEIGDAERALAIMQTAISEQFKKQQRLAMMGLAVAKINHDLRNMLAASQIWSDRLSSVDDPVVQRVAPKIISNIDRAIAFCQNSLAYGRAMEPPPALRRFDLAETVREVADLLAIPEDGSIVFRQEMSDPMMIVADPDQIFRVLLNLSRNAIEAMAQGAPSPEQPGELLIRAAIQNNVIEIDVSDNGPGIPPQLRDRLFQAFTSHARRGGTGLGLAIAAELMRAHGGNIGLQDTAKGTCFRMRLPILTPPEG